MHSKVCVPCVELLIGMLHGRIRRLRSPSKTRTKKCISASCCNPHTSRTAPKHNRMRPVELSINHKAPLLTVGQGTMKDKAVFGIMTITALGSALEHILVACPTLVEIKESPVERQKKHIPCYPYNVCCSSVCIRLTGLTSRHHP